MTATTTDVAALAELEADFASEAAAEATPAFSLELGHVHMSRAATAAHRIEIELLDGFSEEKRDFIWELVAATRRFSYLAGYHTAAADHPAPEGDDPF